MSGNTACGKIILSGEHAVVYGKPGIALPVKDLLTKITIEHSDSFSYVSDIDLEEHEQRKLVQLYEFVSSSLKVDKTHKIYIKSNVPISSGLGSSASLSVAMIRSMLLHHGLRINKKKLNMLAFEAEKIFHGSPSGIDNTVVALEKPVYYKRGHIEVIELKHPFLFVIADTGIKADTKKVVEELRKRVEEDKKKYTRLLDKIEEVTENAKDALINGNLLPLGYLMMENHYLLKQMGVSCDELDNLVETALKAGAYGAKLAGSGRGGHIIALVNDKNSGEVTAALSGVSPGVITTQVK